MTSPVDSLLLIGGLSVFTFAIFGSLLSGIHQDGGKIRAKTYDLPELLVSIVLGGFFAILVVKSALSPGADDAPKVTLDQVIPNALFFVIMLAAISGFLWFRGIDVRVAMGLLRVPFFRAVAVGFGLVIAAFPLVLCASLVTQLVLQQSAQEQDLVTLFKHVARASDRSGIAQIFIAGTVVAPICEEFLFRGLFYVVFKRYLGATASALATSILFAAFHVNAASFPSLFILAICFTIAFEATGSLLVPITMHAIFNGAQLALLYVLSTGKTGA